jgi:hypothetical protein
MRSCFTDSAAAGREIEGLTKDYDVPTFFDQTKPLALLPFN